MGFLDKSGLNYYHSKVAALINDTADDIREDVDDLKNIVEVSSEQPTEEENKLWINTGSTSEIEIPTYAEFQELKDVLADSENKMETKADINDVALLSAEIDRHDSEIEDLNDRLSNETAALSEADQRLADQIASKAESNDVMAAHEQLEEHKIRLDNIDQDLTNKADASSLSEIVANIESLIDSKVSRLDDALATKAEQADVIMIASDMENAREEKQDAEMTYDPIAEASGIAAEVDEIDRNVQILQNNHSSMLSTISNLQSGKIDKPTGGNGTSGQVLSTNGDGTTTWTDPSEPDLADIENAVESWLEEHPEATTTVGDGTITEEKLSPELAAKVNESDSAYDAQVLGDLIQVGTAYEERYMYDRAIRHGTEIFYRYFDKLQEFGSHFTGGDGIGFLWFTDPHNLSPQAYGFNQDDMLEQMWFVRTIFYNTAARYVLCGGDIFNGADYTFEQAVWLVNRAPNILRELISERCYTVVGNHDEEWWGSDQRNYTDQKRARIWYDSDVGYYTVDTSNVRCFMFDSGKAKLSMTTYTLEQAKWFADTLASNTFAHLYGAIHYALTTDGPDWLSNTLTEIANAFNNRSTYTINGQYNYNFSEATGKFHFILAGHYHNDNSDTINGIPVIWTKAFVIDRSIDCCYADFDAEKLYLIRINHTNNGTTRTINI